MILADIGELPAILNAMKIVSLLNSEFSFIQEGIKIIAGQTKLHIFPFSLPVVVFRIISLIFLTKFFTVKLN